MKSTNCWSPEEDCVHPTGSACSLSRACRLAPEQTGADLKTTKGKETMRVDGVSTASTVVGSLDKGMDTTKEQSIFAALRFLSAFFTVLRYNFLPPITVSKIYTQVKAL